MRHFLILLFVVSMFSMSQDSYAALEISEAQKSTLQSLFMDEPYHQQWLTLLRYIPESENTDLQIIAAQTALKAGAARIKQSIANIDLAKVKRLENNYSLLQQKYTPLFTHYKALQVQFSSLPTSSTTEYRKALRLQINAMLPAILIARTSLSVARTRLQSAKKSRTTKMSGARTKWRILHSHTRSFSWTKSRMKLQESHLRTEWKSLLKQKDRSTAAVSLQSCVKYAQSLVVMKQNFLNQLTSLNQQINHLAKQF